MNYRHVFWVKLVPEWTLLSNNTGDFPKVRHDKLLFLQQSLGYICIASNI